MEKIINVLGLQIEPKICDRKVNFEKVEALLEKNSWLKPDLVVLPEVFATGIFAPELCTREAELFPGEIYNKLSDWSKKYNTNILGGSIIEACEDGKYRNNSILFNRQGKEIASYYKLHMFSHYGSREGDFCTPGKEVVVAETDIGVIGMSVCYDLRFPELYRALINNGAEIIVVPAAWPSPRLLHWVNLNKARAIENQSFVIAVNQVGLVPPKRVNAGHSMVIDPWGSVIACAGEKETAMFACIDLGEVHKLREEFPIFNDRNYAAYGNVKLYDAKQL